MQELISPQQSETLVLLAALVTTVLGAGWGARVRGVRGSLLGVVGLVVWGAWQFHKWLTRLDPRGEYFGLDKVWVLMLEVVLFTALGAVLGMIIKKQFIAQDTVCAEET